MSEERFDEGRRRALKIIGIAGAGATASIYDNPTFGQAVINNPYGAQNKSVRSADAPKFFNPEEMRAISAMTELIIPTDAHSPGAIAAGVPAFIDMMIAESNAETRQLWRDGLAAMNQASTRQHKKNFADASPQQQTRLLTEASVNEFKPTTIEERFFRAIKSLTIDGYYTSEVGIHQDLEYKGNSYQKTMPGCTDAR